MPIDIDQFDDASAEELGEETNAERVVKFLVRNDDKAFTPSEIVETTGVKQSSIGTVLRRLEKRGLVRHKGNYWAIGDEDEFRDAHRFHRFLEDMNDRAGAEDVDEWRDHAAEETE
jgi:DNA-binding GntR family transcriptional regulator